MTLGNPVQMYRMANQTSQTGVWRHMYQVSSVPSAGWIMERALGRLYTGTDGTVAALYQYKMLLNSQEFYRLSTSSVAPTGWSLDSTVGYVYTAQPTGPASPATVSLYDLTYDWNGTTLYFHTTSAFEADYCINVLKMTSLGRIGWLLPAALSMRMQTTATQGVATSVPTGQTAELKTGDCLELWLDQDVGFGQGSKITSVAFFTQDPDKSPGVSPAYTYTSQSGIVAKTIGSSQYRMWYQGDNSVLIANNEASTLSTNRPPVWFQLSAQDATGQNWTLDPELINDGGDADGGPGWTVG